MGSLVCDMTEIRKGARIAYGILDWGLGHATRSIPLIQALLQHDCEVHIASSGSALKLMAKEFPELPFHALPAYDIHYKYQPFWWGMVRQLPKIYKAFAQEHQQLLNWTQQMHFSTIISDNRLGFYHPDIPSIYLTHQLQLELGVWSEIATQMHRHFMQQFQSVWVPDSKSQSLAGKLASPRAKGLPPTQYIGHPSRLPDLGDAVPEDGPILLLLSGPEPQRSRWEKWLYEQASTLSKWQFVLVRGRIDAPILPSIKHIQVENLVNGERLHELLKASRLVVARSGYSTLLDLSRVNRPLVAVPTPGQGEQEYLARWHAEQRHLILGKQGEGYLMDMIESGLNFPGRLPQAQPIGLPLQH
jgi:hypothetical protein